MSERKAPTAEYIEVDQDAHPDGAIFGVVNPLDNTRSSRTVLCIEQGKTREERMARSQHNGLRHVLRSRTTMHPHVWPPGLFAGKRPCLD